MDTVVNANVNGFSGSVCDFEDANIYEHLSIEIGCKDDKSSMETNSVGNPLHDMHIVDMKLNAKGFNIGHLNVQGIVGKIDQIKLMLSSKENNVAILGLTETKLNANHNDDLFHCQGYNKPLRRDRETARGVLLYTLGKR